MKTTVACVLKSGGDYTASDVAALQARIAVHLPGADFVCLSDVDVPCRRIPLEQGWPGWWSKIELFRPDIAGKLLYVDLDTVPVGDLTDLAKIRKTAIMRDVYRPDGLQSAVMVIPQAAKAEIWNAFTADPAGNMAACTVRWSKWGDQGFIEQFWTNKAARLQDLLPGQIVSWKADRIAETGVPADARLIVFHGRPRPTDVGY